MNLGHGHGLESWLPLSNLAIRKPWAIPTSHKSVDFTHSFLTYCSPELSHPDPVTLSKPHTLTYYILPYMHLRHTYMLPYLNPHTHNVLHKSIYTYLNRVCARQIYTFTHIQMFGIYINNHILEWTNILFTKFTKHMLLYLQRACAHIYTMYMYVHTVHQHQNTPTFLKEKKFIIFQ